MTDHKDDVRKVMDGAETITPDPDAKVLPEGDPRTPLPDAADVPAIEVADAQLIATAGLPLNDYGNGKRFAHHFGADMLFVPRVGWFCWDGRVWLKDPDEVTVKRKSQQVAALIKAEIPFLVLDEWQMAKLEKKKAVQEQVFALEAIEAPTEEEKAALAAAYKERTAITSIAKMLASKRADHHRHAKSAGNAGPMNHMVDQGQVNLHCTLDDLDADPLMVNTHSGILQFTIDEAAKRALRDEGCSDYEGLAKLSILPHDRVHRLTKIMPVEYDPKATCPLFDAFLLRIQPERDMREFLQRWFGLSMTALIGDQKLVFFYGVGANGKSVLVDLMARMLDGYAATAKIESLTGSSKRSGSEATPDLVPLMGARMVRASEPEQGERLKEGTIKELTSGEPMLVRALNQDFVEVLPQFKLTISGNYKPEIRGTDDGIWRRVLLTPFDVQIPKEDRDQNLGKKLWQERAGILNWMIAGLCAYLENGLSEPERVIAATEAFREESDPVHSFLMDCCEVSGDEKVFTRTAELVESFKSWQRDRGETPWQDTTIARRLADKAGKWRDPRSGCSFAKHKASVSGYRGLAMTAMFLKRREDAALQRQYGGDPF